MVEHCIRIVVMAVRFCPGPSIIYEKSYYYFLFMGINN